MISNIVEKIPSLVNVVLILYVFVNVNGFKGAILKSVSCVLMVSIIIITLFNTIIRLRHQRYY